MEQSTKMRISQLSSGVKGADEFCGTFVFENEGFTLGHALHCIISRLPDVKYCGITMQNESSLAIQIQTFKGRPVDILKKGLQDLAAVSDHILDAFNNELESNEIGE